jgi:hypothetical protein
MNLDFLDVLSQPIPKPSGTVGTAGTANVHAGSGVPTEIPAYGNSGNKTGNTEDSSPTPIADTAKCSHLFPVCSQPVGTELANVYADVPAVPAVPTQIDMSATQTGSDRPAMPAGVQLIRWESKEAPVQLTKWERVTDTEKFIAINLGWPAGLRGLFGRTGRHEGNVAMSNRKGSIALLEDFEVYW